MNNPPKVTERKKVRYMYRQTQCARCYIFLTDDICDRCEIWRIWHIGGLTVNGLECPKFIQRFIK